MCWKTNSQFCRYTTTWWEFGLRKLPALMCTLSNWIKICFTISICTQTMIVCVMHHQRIHHNLHAYLWVHRCIYTAWHSIKRENELNDEPDKVGFRFILIFQWIHFFCSAAAFNNKNIRKWQMVKISVMQNMCVNLQ